MVERGKREGGPQALAGSPEPQRLGTLHQEGEMATIVEYCDTKRPVNIYPRRIISPGHPKPCCVARMVQVGGLQQDERGRPFSYRRCEVCGFTLRHFLPVVPPDVPAYIQRQKRLPRMEEVA